MNYYYYYLFMNNNNNIKDDFRRLSERKTRFQIETIIIKLY